MDFPPSTAQRAQRHNVGLLLAALVWVSSCAPELNTPASTNVSGMWTSPGPAAGLTDVTIQLSQTGDGTITGTYNATGAPETQYCPPTPPCSISGNIRGTNDVFQVYFELQDAGQFSGQLIDGSRLKGSMARVNSIGPILFTRVMNAASAAH